MTRQDHRARSGTQSTVFLSGAFGANASCSLELFLSFLCKSCLRMDTSPSLCYFCGRSHGQPHCSPQTPTPQLLPHLPSHQHARKSPTPGIRAGSWSAVTGDKCPHGADQLSNPPPPVKTYEKAYGKGKAAGHPPSASEVTPLLNL